MSNLSHMKGVFILMVVKDIHSFIQEKNERGMSKETLLIHVDCDVGCDYHSSMTTSSSVYTKNVI
jgi:hypothetical protein